MAPPYVYLPLVCPLVHMAAGKSRVERGDPGGEKPGWVQEGYTASNYTLLIVSSDYKYALFFYVRNNYNTNASTC